MRPVLVVILHSLSDHRPGLTQRFERVLPDALFFPRPDEALHEAVLVRRVRRRERLEQTVGLYRRRVLPGAECQPVVGPESQWPPHSLEVAVALGERLL